MLSKYLLIKKSCCKRLAIEISVVQRLSFLGPLGASIASILPLSYPRVPRAEEPNLPLPGLTPLSFVFLGPLGVSVATIFPPSRARGPKRQTTPELKKGPFATSKGLYCQHLPPILTQGPGAKEPNLPLPGLIPYLLSFLGPWGPLLPPSSSHLAPGAPEDKRQATPEFKKEPFATSKGLYCQHLPPILAQGPPRRGAKPALTRADALILPFLGLQARPRLQHKARHQYFGLG